MEALEEGEVPVRQAQMEMEVSLEPVGVVSLFLGRLKLVWVIMDISPVVAVAEALPLVQEVLVGVVQAVIPGMALRLWPIQVAAEAVHLVV